MCVQCKGLVGCNKNGCTQAPAPKQSVAELLGRAFPRPELQPRTTASSARTLARRETPNHAVAS